MPLVKVSLTILLALTLHPYASLRYPLKCMRMIVITGKTTMHRQTRSKYLRFYRQNVGTSASIDKYVCIDRQVVGNYVWIDKQLVPINGWASSRYLCIDIQEVGTYVWINKQLVPMYGQTSSWCLCMDKQVMVPMHRQTRSGLCMDKQVVGTYASIDKYLSFDKYQVPCMDIQAVGSRYQNDPGENVTGVASDGAALSLN